MYCAFYGLKEKPFTITPNPRFVFFSKNHREAFAHLLYGIDNHAGFIELTGEVGTGKTTVLRTLLGQLDDEHHRLALIFNPALSAVDLLSLINREFGIRTVATGNSELLDNLYQFLLSENAAGRTVVLVIDEAQNLAPQVLEQIRLISNLETETDKLIQIVLAGQPELGDLLQMPELRQINQRITVRYHLRPMDFDDMTAYIEHRLDVAGGRWVVSFNPKALKMLYREARGIPRIINVICDRALLIGFTEEKRVISARMMAQAIAEVKGERKGSLPTNLWRLAAVTLLVLLLIAGAGFVTTYRGSASEHFRTLSPRKLSPAASKELQDIATTANTLVATNAVLQLWGAALLKDGREIRTPDELKKLAVEHGLQFFRFSGSLGLLRRMDTPALLEFALPAGKGRGYLALVGADHDRFLLKPALQTRGFLTSAELDNAWSGRAGILWKNHLDIPLSSVPGMRGAKIVQLQTLLKKAGFYTGEPTGVYDRETVAAVRSLQSSWGINADGRVGEQTLFLMYRSANVTPFPRLGPLVAETKR